MKKFKPKDCSITIKLSGRDNTVGYLTLEDDNQLIEPLIAYAADALDDLEGYVSDGCFEHLKGAGISSLNDLYTVEPNDFVTNEALTKEDLVELVDCGIVELRFRKLEPKEEALPANVTKIRKVKKG